MSKKEKIYERIAKLDKWLAEQSVNVKKEQMHLTKDTRERLYWHYGYIIVLRDAMKAVSQELPCVEMPMRRLAEMKARPVTHAGRDRHDRKKSIESDPERRAITPMPSAMRGKSPRAVISAM